MLAYAVIYGFSPWMNIMLTYLLIDSESGDEVLDAIIQTESSVAEGQHLAISRLARLRWAALLAIERYCLCTNQTTTRHKGYAQDAGVLHPHPCRLNWCRPPPSASPPSEQTAHTQLNINKSKISHENSRNSATSLRAVADAGSP
jgi:hypothetical protein